EGAARGRGAGLGEGRGDPTVPGPQASQREGPRRREALARTGATALGGVPRGLLRDGRGVAGGDGAMARPPEPGRGVEPAGGPGGDADGGAAGRAGGAAADAGDDQPDRVGAERDAACDGARESLA